MDNTSLDEQIIEFQKMGRFEKAAILGMAAAEKERREREILVTARIPRERQIIVEGIIGSIAVLKTTRDSLKDTPYTGAYIDLDEEVWVGTNGYWSTPEQAYLDSLAHQHEGPNSGYASYAYKMLDVKIMPEVHPIDEFFFVGEDFECSCGNNSGLDGFYPCLRNGTVVEPTLDSGWVDLYRCERCEKIYRSMNG